MDTSASWKRRHCFEEGRDTVVGPVINPNAGLAGAGHGQERDGRRAEDRVQEALPQVNSPPGLFFALWPLRGVIITGFISWRPMICR